MQHGSGSLLERTRESPTEVRWSDLLRLVEALGFVLCRRCGAHHIYSHATRRELPLLSLQSGGTRAKPYRVRQVLRLIEEHNLEVCES
jgi:predicted RNA binding protein YcfA (HicA-like mRNA interferase family)